MRPCDGEALSAGEDEPEDKASTNSNSISEALEVWTTPVDEVRDSPRPEETPVLAPMPSPSSFSLFLSPLSPSPKSEVINFNFMIKGGI